MTLKTRVHRDRPELHFSGYIEYDKKLNRHYINIPRGYVFVGDGDKVEVDMKWLTETVVYQATWTE